MMDLEEKVVLPQSCAHFQAQPDRRDSALSLTLPNENNQLDERIYIAKRALPLHFCVEMLLK
jgi:hypothetical protein